MEPVQLLDLDQTAPFAPARCGENFPRRAVTTGRKGLQTTAPSHPRAEVTLTLRGEAMLRAGGADNHMTGGTKLRLPPALDHTVVVWSDARAVAPAAMNTPGARNPTEA
ncbi:cupin domain-containing protein [Salipiger bermudensis]|uniref:cupin domain-containing protein n=1 Tax=Salipiger bermudensis TaxID=344736 RepID=UPI001C9914BD|nr:cupin domain-containing protein [Salipiger bermudensis]MBY6005259.1 cupin domain-containing protein [Salipiger bermudensis]